jgi:Emfourin
MKITFRQSGGFAGLLRGAEMDAQALDPKQTAELKRLLDEKAATQSRGPGKARDLHQYEITLEDGGQKRTLQFDDSQVPEDLRPLLKTLKQQAKPQPPS